MGLFTDISDIFRKDKQDTNGDELSQKQYQKMVDAYFAEYGIHSPQVVVKENTVLARKYGDDGFRIKKMNGRAVSSNIALSLGEATPDGLIQINKYRADTENMGGEAAEFEQLLAEKSSPEKMKNVIWHEGRHIIDFAKNEDKLYDVGAAQFLELKHDQEKSAFRESAFRELLEYKNSKNPKCITEDNLFLQESNKIDFTSANLSEDEIKLVVEGIDKMYAETKQGVYEKKYKDALWLDWSIKRQVLGKTGNDEQAYAQIKKTYNNHMIKGQHIDVSPYVSTTSVNDLMSYMINTNDKIPFTEEERQKYGAVPEAKITAEDIGKTEQNVIAHKGSDTLILADMEHNYKKFEEPTFEGQISSAFHHSLIIDMGVVVENSTKSFLERQKEIRTHNADVEMRKNDLPGFLATNKAYQTMFSKQENKGENREENLQQLRNFETGNITLELLVAYGNGQQEQLCKINPDLPATIAKVCPSLIKQDDTISPNIKLSEFRQMQQYVDKNLEKIAPDFTHAAESFYDREYGSKLNSSENTAQKISDNMQKGHSRITEMRAKVAKGHDEERMTMYQEFANRDSSASETLRELRSSKVLAIGAARPTAISAEILAKKLQSYQSQSQ